MQDIIDSYDVDIASDALMEHLYSKAEPGTFFKDAHGKKWKYLAKSTEDITGNEVYIASHGDFGIVMTLHDLDDGNVRAETELKRRQD